MDTKLLSATNWKNTALKLKVPKLKENDRLQQYLSNFERVPEEKFDDRLKALGTVLQSAMALKKAKEIAAKTGSEPMIAHIDSNPFGAKTNLRQTLTESLTKVARAISW